MPVGRLDTPNQKVITDQILSEDSIIPESRQAISDVVKEAEEDDKVHSVDGVSIEQMRPECFDDVEQFLARQAELWLGVKTTDPIDVAALLERDPFLFTLLNALGGKLRDFTSVCEKLARSNSFFRDLSPQER